jgi:hypothetical protein
VAEEGENGCKKFVMVEKIDRQKNVVGAENANGG